MTPEERAKVTEEYGREFADVLTADAARGNLLRIDLRAYRSRPAIKDLTYAARAALDELVDALREVEAEVRRDDASRAS